jgi:hypothetical protein
MRFLRTHPRLRCEVAQCGCVYVLARSQFPALGVCCGSKTEVSGLALHVRFTLGCRHRQPAPACLFGAMNGLMQRSKWHFYSISSSARPLSASGTVMPSALAVLRLMISSTFVALWTGRSPGFAPLRIFPV